MSQLVLAGVATADITPSVGAAMAGFAVRTGRSTGVHDRLTARALAVGNTVLITVDVIGLNLASCSRVYRSLKRYGLATIVTATHTHGGPATLPQMMGARADPAYLAFVEDRCVEAARQAAAGRRPARLFWGTVPNPGIAKNRRRPGGPVDQDMTVVKVLGADRTPIATLISYSCHPVVLGPDNTLLTADYPGFLRCLLEDDSPGAVALFLPGCCGDANSGHSAADSQSLSPTPARSFEAARQIAQRLFRAARHCRLDELETATASAARSVQLDFKRRETEPYAALARTWRAKAAASTDPQRSVVSLWADWAERQADTLSPPPIVTRLGLFDWGRLKLLALPGEMFAQTAIDLRYRLHGIEGARGGLAFSYSMDCPGYIPPASEYPFGGYEIDQAHRYFGQPASFHPDSEARIQTAALALAVEMSAKG